MSAFAGYDFLRIFPFAASGLLVLLSLWLNRRWPQALLWSWTVAHGFGTASLGLELMSCITGRPTALNVLAAMADGLCGIFLLNVGLRLKDPACSRRWLRWALPVAVAVPLALGLADGSFMTLVAPSVAFRCCAFIWLGAVYVRRPVLGDPIPTRALGGALAVYGGWTLSYPLVDGGPFQMLSIWSNGAVLLVVGVAMAVHLLERNARELEVLIAEGKHHALVLLDTEGRISSWNLGAERLFGLRACETVSRDRAMLGSRCPLDPDHTLEETDWTPRKDGTRFWGETTFSPIRGPDRHLRGFAMLVRDVSDRRVLERERARLTAVVQQSQDAMLIVDCNRTIRYVNPAFERRSGRASATVVGETLFSVFGEETGLDQRDLQAALESRKGWSGRLHSRRPDGARLIEDLHIWPLQVDGEETPPDFVVVARDVTREHLLQEQLYQAQKLEEIGRIAGGVAHDFGNLLAIIVAYNHLLQTSKPTRQLLETSTGAIRRATDRAASLIRQLLAFGRKEVASPQVLDLDLLVEQTTSMLTRVVGERIKLRAERGAPSAFVRADPGQLEQVITNLVVNARDAMPSGGEVTLSTANEEIFDETSGLALGRYVCLSVRDEGVGMSPADRARVFEPFFTTKPPGMGTGLGLAVVNGIVGEAGGAVRVDSQLGKGSTFRVYLPATDSPGSLPDAGDGEAATNERETVLLAEADSQPSRAVLAVLRSQGYRVLEAHTEEEALRLGHKHAGEIDLLIGPAVHAPNNALALAVALRRDQPEMRVLLTSNPQDEQALRAGGLSGAPVLTHPFEREELDQKLRELFGRSAERKAGSQAVAAAR